MTEIEDIIFVKIDETDYRVTDKEITLVENIRTDEIDPYELINSNEESHSSESNESDSDD